MSDSLLLLKYLTAFVLFVSHVTLFGYMELKWSLFLPLLLSSHHFLSRNSGWMISVSLALYLFYQRGTIFPTFLSLCGVILQFNQQEKLSYLFFFLLEAIFFFSSAKSRQERNEIDSELIQFKPYEAEIRQYLLQKDPSLLHKVDGLLVKYEGKEDELMRKLRSKYEITSHTASSSSSSAAATSMAPITLPSSHHHPFIVRSTPHKRT
jgi:hypothetical protein